MDRITARAAGELRTVPGVHERRRSHRPSGPRRPGGRQQLGRDVGERRPVGRLREDGRGGEAGRRRLSRPPPRRRDVHAGPAEAGPLWDLEPRDREGVRRRPGHAQAEGGRGPRAAVRHQGCAWRACRCARRGAHDGGRGRPGQGAAVRDQARRCPSCVGGDALWAPRRQPLRAAEGLRRAGLEHPGEPPQPHERPQPPASTRPTVGTSASATWPTCGFVRRCRASTTRTSRASSTSRPTCADARSAPSPTISAPSSSGCSSRSSTTRRC